MTLVSRCMRTFITMLFFAVAIIAACGKDDHQLGDNYVTLSYKQTQCSDPWITSHTDSITLKAVLHYLDSTKLYVASAYMTNVSNSNIICDACFCETGKRINITTLKSDVLIARYNQIGFR